MRRCWAGLEQPSIISWRKKHLFNGQIQATFPPTTWRRRLTSAAWGYYRMIGAAVIQTGIFAATLSAWVQSAALDLPAAIGPIMHWQMDRGPERVISVQSQNKTFMMWNIFPFQVDLRILGSGPSFPQVVRMPAAPGAPVAIPYPSTSMPIQLRVPGGNWSSTFNITWKLGNITLPGF